MHQTLRINVQDPDKTTFITLGVCIYTYPEIQKIDPQTIFINQEGMYDLVMSSRKPEAKIFRRWISHEVPPSINRFGSYSIEKKHGCFYDDHDLYEYDGCNVCYRNDPKSFYFYLQRHLKEWYVFKCLWNKINYV